MKRFLPLLLLFNGCGLAYSAEFPTGTQIEILSDFSGGLYTASPAQKIGKNFSPNMRNVFVHREPQKITKRNGFTVVGSTSSLQRISNGLPFYHLDGSKEFLVTDSSQMLSTKDYQTYVFVSSAMNSATNIECAQAGNKIFCTNGSDPVFTWDGTTKVNMNGTNGTPNIPRGRYITYFLNRIWVGNTSADNTSLDWSAVVSTNGTILTPDNFLAWPPLNHHSVGQGDGETLNGLKVYRGQLQIGKDDSIYTEFGDRDSNFLERKTVSQAGVSSQDSMVILDGILYYKGRNGIYAFDGSQAQRISDLIQPDVATMQDPTSKILQNIWDTQSQFANGQFFGSTATVDGFLTNSEQHLLINTAETNPGGTWIQLNSTTVFDTGFSTLVVPGTPAPSGFYGPIYSIKLWGRWNDNVAPGAGCAGAQLTVTVKNPRTGLTKSLPSFVPSFAGNAPLFDRQLISFPPSGLSEPFWGPEEINNSSFTIQLLLTGAPNTCVIDIIPSTNTNKSTIDLYPSSITQFMSQVTTLTSVNAWSYFNSINNTNGGIISYFFRSSTSAVNITTQTWQSITPGVIIGVPLINNFIQWASTMDGLTNGNLVKANIDIVTIDHIEGGGSVNRPFATDWNNEYWLTISTDLSSSMKLQYIKSWVTNNNPNAWMAMNGINISSIWKDGANTLYGGSSSTGTIYRLDYGTNDNGKAIDAFYETSDLVLKGALTGGYDGNWLEEQLYEYWVDADAESGNTFRLGTSLNGGAFTEDLISLTSTMPRVLYTVKNPSKFAKFFRWRFRNNQLDKGLNLNNYAILYTPLKTR